VKRRTYKDAKAQRIYDAMIKSGDKFPRDTGTPARAAYWMGRFGWPAGVHCAGSTARAIHAAGKDIYREKGAPDFKVRGPMGYIVEYRPDGDY
jgi:NifU-like protein involved in Fe-S cluster formation